MFFASASSHLSISERILPLAVLLIVLVQAVALEALPFKMTNDARFVAALDPLIVACEGASTHAEDEYDWLVAGATAADRPRRYEIAEAAMTVVTERWLLLTWPWGTLFCNSGSQGRFIQTKPA